MIGSTIAHYKITAKLGEGGMGEVYRARDDRLNRDVAIKLLPASVEQSPERLARFRREAQVLASLTHGNIAQVYGLEEEDGRSAIVLELVEGEDLSTRIARGALAFDDAREIALQIAEALEVAHEKGIVHRDLKPANVKITPEGTVKVLDFGLAKALEAEPGSDSGAHPTASPTVTSAQTRDGVILGTAAYMSPEQARGKAVDKRADIWAFGCVLYEMLTGTTTFAAETISDTLVAVLSGEPDRDALPAETPAAVRRLIDRCLTRDARRRLRDIGEARVVLEDAGSGDAPADDRAADPETRRRSPLGWVWVAIAGVVLFAAGWMLRPTPDSTPALSPDRSIKRLTFEEGVEQEPTLSPDGNYVAYSTDRQGNLDIEVLPLGGGSVVRITDHPADDAQPRWSPDGTKLAFVSARDREGGLLVSTGGLGADSIFVSSENGDIFLIPALGGTATKLIDRGAYPTWSPDGTSIAFQSNRDGEWRLWRVAATGGEPRQLTSGEPGTFNFHPSWSPDGRWIAYARRSPNGARGGLCVIPAEGGDPIQLTEDEGFSPAWSADGKSLYYSSGRASAQGVVNLWRIPFDPGAETPPPSQRLTLGTTSDIGASPSTDDRRLAYANVQFAPDLWSLDVTSGELRQWTSSDEGEDYPHLNPDGRRLLFDSNRSGVTKLWVKDVRDGGLEPFSTPGLASHARWSPDGHRIAYQGEEGEGTIVAIQRWGDATRETLGAESNGASTGIQWSPDGTRLIAGNATDLWVHTPGQGSHLLIENGSFPTWSPDGTQVAYQRYAGSDHREIYAVSPEGGEPRMIAGGAVHYSHPQWHPSDADRILIVIDHKDLGILHVVSGEVERITELASSTVLVDYPSWSADGTTVYFSIARMRGDLFMIEQ